MIEVMYTTVDHFRQRRSFKTLEGARRYAQKWVGPTPEVSYTFQYAVSSDGVGKVEVSGARLLDLFPALKNDATEEEAP